MVGHGHSAGCGACGVAILTIGLIRIAERKKWISVQARTALDDVISRLSEGCFLVVTLQDGKTIGGRFGHNSFASSYPDSGHLFIQELWDIEGDNLLKQSVGSQGIILRPGDYKHIRIVDAKFGR